MSDKRKFERYAINVPVRVEFKNPDGLLEKFDLEAINLAAGGILFKKGISLPEGSRVKLEVEFYFENLKTPENPEGALIMTVTGHVVRTEHEGMAIRFNEDYEVSQCLSFLQMENKREII
jgi:hypothetical protein